MKFLIVLNLLFIALSSSTATSINFESAPPIVGGSFAVKNEFPHQVALILRGSLRCGGSIITEQFVLTAAHCLVNKQYLNQFEVLAGANNLGDKDGQRYKIIDEVPHEGYGDHGNTDDIALLIVEKPFIFSESVKPIELQTSELEIGSEIKIIGWGKTSAYGQISQDLKYNTVTVQSNNQCGGIQYNGLICLGHPKDNGACNGDSGGSAISQEGKLVGVANFVMVACGTTYPDGYAKVSFYNDWINSNMDKLEEKYLIK
jgi:secreted trypsin-like serine protease